MFQPSMKRTQRRQILWAAIVFTAVCSPLFYLLAVTEQQPPAAAGQAQPVQTPPGQPGGRGAGGRGGFPQPDPLDHADYSGWTSLFDGATLNGWDGNASVWKVESGAITAESTCENPTGTTYLVWQGGEPGDFELKAEMRGEGPGINSGIQYRSFIQPPGEGRGVPGAPGRAAAPAGASGTPSGGRGPAGPCPSGKPRGTQPARETNAKWNLGGPQLDFDGTNRYSGQYYEGGTQRGIVAWRGQVVASAEGKKMQLLSTLGDPEALGGYLNINNWNQIHLIARGNTLIHLINGRVMSVFIDNDKTKFRPKGLIGLQIEGTGKISFRNIHIKQYPTTGSAPQAPVVAVQAPPAQSGTPAARGGRGGFTQPEPIRFDDHEGWTNILDGTDATYRNWEGYPGIWHLDADNRTVWAESTCENNAGSTYMIWRGGEPADFELKLEIRGEGNVNSGFQYRSFINTNAGRGGGGAQAGAAGATAPGGTVTPLGAAASAVRTVDPGGRQGRGQPSGPCPSGLPRGAAPSGPEYFKFAVGGYQFDFNYGNNFTGQVYEGATQRGIIAFRGQVVRTEREKKARLIGSAGDLAPLGGYVKINDWNQVHIIARGNVLIHMLNGHVMAALVDDDPANFKSKGLLALQIEGMGKVSYRNIWLKTY